MTPFNTLRTLLFALFVLAGTAPSARGTPFDVTTRTTSLGGSEVSVDIYRPQRSGPSGIALLAHGFTRDRLRDRDLAEALAAAGIVAVAPDLPSAVNSFGNGDAVAGLVTELERGTLGLPPTPRSRIVLIGTSAGGLATVIAASNLPGIAGWIGLDPVDGTGAGVLAARKLRAPSVVLLADPSVCNLFGSGRLIARSVRSLIRSERLRGASHCDFEGPTNTFCKTVCGRGSREMAETVRREAVSATLDMLDPSAESRGGTRDAPADDDDTQ
ncbi:MAG: hypothetical protein ABI533_05265 [Betaproteobacteria bacterium]